MDTEKLWQSALAEIELQTSRLNFLTWFKNSRLIEKNDRGEALVGLANNFAKEWVEHKYHKTIFTILKNLDDSVRKIEYRVIINNAEATKEPRIKTEPKPQPSFAEFKTDPETNLSPRYDFKSFVVGSSNELASAAAMAVVKNVGKKYNPLFIYGGTGLGKTHLIQATGNEIKEAYKNKVKVKYVTSEKFVNDVIAGIRNKRMEDVKTKYRNVDVLIVDDIQFIGGKERSEEEFFYTFNVLYENNKQIIISSDRPPAAIPVLEERLRSRFEGGMIVDITYPDFEMKLAIIKNKLQEQNAHLPDDVCELIANKIQKNIRELEGILNKILFHQEMKGAGPTRTVIEEIINNAVRRSAKNITPQQILKIVADFFEIEYPSLINRSRKKGLVEPRQIAAFLLREILGMSYPDIGDRLGKRDHTTAMYSYNKISQETGKNQRLNQKLELIKEIIYKN